MMDDLNDLKALWLSADTSVLPNAGEVVATIKNYRNGKLIKTTLLVFAALCMVGLMVAATVLYHSAMLSTRIGEICMILAGLILAATNINTVNRFYKHRDLSNKEFIAFLEHTRVRRLFYYTKTQVACLTLCSAGLMFYLYELVYKNTKVGVAVYMATVVYLLVIWLIVRPRVYRRQAAKLNELILRMEKLSKQL